ncbi:MAG: PorV/PorQ family protein [Brevinematales bacterium]|nr:PorV/PorQ family protein [Brevinematales bacterium]
MKKTAIITLFIAVFAGNLRAEYGMSSIPVFMIENYVARSLGMADCGLTVKGDVNFITVNPASMARVKLVSFGASRMTWLFGSAYNAFNFALPIPSKYNSAGVIGLTAALFTIDGFDATVNGISQGIMNSGDFMAGVTYANNLFAPFDNILADQQHLDMGVTVKFAQAQLADYTAYSLAFDVGVTYSLKVKNFTDFLDVRQFKGETNLTDTLTFSAGLKNLALSLKGFTDNGQVQSPWYFGFGAAYVVFDNDRHVGTAMMEVRKPSDNIWMLAAGAEYSYKNTIFVRGGYKIVGKDYEGFSFGLGLNFEVTSTLAFTVDYSFAPLDYQGQTDAFSLSVVF